MSFNTDALRQKYPQIFTIVSPPRCSSTALARIFWEHPQIRYYAHEPFESMYFLDQDLDGAFDKLMDSMDLKPLKKDPDSCDGSGLVIKVMPYQVGENFELLAGFTTAPLVFLIRDPRINIASRMKKKLEVGDNPLFPSIETGWELLEKQITFCDTAGIPYFVVDSKDFRGHPKSVLRELFTRMHLSFSEEMLVWQPQPSIDIDNLDGTHTHLYEQVLQSGKLIPDDTPIPPIEFFPEEDEFRQHVIECLGIYQKLREHAHLVQPVTQ
jgi:hypothetical protein